MENNKFISYIDEIAVTDESSKKITIDELKKIIDLGKENE